MTTTREIVSDRRDEYAFHDDIDYLAQTKRGLSRDTVTEISRFKDEPDWMLQFRLRAYEHFLTRPMPTWGGNLLDIDLDKIVYYRKPSAGEEKSWDDVPEKIKATFEKLGIPEAERKFLAGVGAQYDSEVVYHSVREELSKIGVVFMGTDQALKEYPELFRKYFATVVRPRTTSSPRSTARSGPAARSCTYPRASRSPCRCKPTSGSTARTPASSNGP